MVKTIYLNLEDDVAKITSKLKREKVPEVVLVFPKKSFIFADSINLRLLKKQIDMMGKTASILTMDEVGQMYAKEAGFALRFLPKSPGPRGFSDIGRRSHHTQPPAVVLPEMPEPEAMASRPVKRPTKLLRKAVPGVAVVPTSPIRRTIKSSTTTTKNAEGLAAALPSLAARSAQVSRQRAVPPLAKHDSQINSRLPRKKLIAFVAISLVVLMVLMLVVLPHAEVIAYAKVQNISRDIDMNLDTKVTSADAAKLTMPAKQVSELVDQSQTFQTTGKKEVGSKAQGRVVIYNLTGSPINLKATTTVLSVGNKNYTFDADQNNIKALSSPNNDTGATLGDITAQNGGEAYNLPAGTRMEITNQAFGTQPQRLYAKTVSQVVGGASRFISVISADDIKAAQKGINTGVVDGIRTKLKDQNLTLLSDAYIATPAEFTTDKPVGTETPSFTASTKVQITGFAFDQDQLVKLLRERLALSMGENKTLQDAAQDSITLKVRNVDLANGILALAIHYESKAIPKIDEAGIRQQISGKSKQEASEILLSNPDIDHIEIKLSPSWQSSIPWFGSKVDLKVQ